MTKTEELVKAAEVVARTVEDGGRGTDALVIRTLIARLDTVTAELGAVRAKAAAVAATEETLSGPGKNVEDDRQWFYPPCTFECRHDDCAHVRACRALSALLATPSPAVEEREGRLRREAKEAELDREVEQSEAEFPKGAAVVFRDGSADDAPWVRGRVEFVCNRRSGGWAGEVSIYCDDGRGRRVVPPHRVVRAAAIEAGGER